MADAIRRVKALKQTAASQSKLIADVGVTMQAVRKNFSVQERGRLLLVPVADVLYLKAEAKYVTLRTREREYLLEGALSSLEQEFATQFIRVHRNALVARHAITGVERGQLTVDAEHDSEGDKPQEAWQVILRDIDDRLPISRRQWSAVKALVR